MQSYVHADDGAYAVKRMDGNATVVGFMLGHSLLALIALVTCVDDGAAASERGADGDTAVLPTNTTSHSADDCQ